VGYILSPLASRRLHNTFSVGRVQSPAVRLVVDREREIQAFKTSLYWILNIQLNKGGTTFLATHVKGKFERQPDATAILEAIKGETHAVAEKVDQKETRQTPKPPFTTVDLQAAAAARLKFTPEQTMKLAQALFDHGLTTYHRTDSVRMDEAFIAQIREYAEKTFGAAYVPDKPNAFKSKNSQAEAHEGVRPTHIHPASEIAALIDQEQLSPDHARLYELIYRRAVASQMAPARFDATLLLFDVAGEKFKASGRILKFDGFFKVYAEVDEEKERKGDKGDEEKVQALPPITLGERVPKEKETLDEKKTKPPGRFTLGSLVKELERLGIGRPSTYASITKNITDRGYVKEEKGKVVPLPPGETLVDYLKAQNPWVIDYELTSKMEAILDQVVEHKETWQRFCKAVHNKMGYATPPVRGVNGGPSEAQLKYATHLAARDKVTIPEDTLKNGKALSGWISERVGKKDTPG
jgi:DNA topoisomerase-1